jgi:hypothetical protein
VIAAAEDDVPMLATHAPDAGSSAVKRVLSKRFKAGSTTAHLNFKEVLDLAKKLNNAMPKGFKVANLKDKSVAELDAFLDDGDHMKATAALSAQFEAARQKMTQPVQRDVCFRILMLLATEPLLLNSYKDSLAGSDQHQVDAGNKTNKNSGLGMGLNHRYHRELCEAFNDISRVADFPFEYHVNCNGRHVASDATTEVVCPQKLRGGFFAGMGLQQPKIPEGFPVGFFDIQRLETVFASGKSEYHNMMSRRVGVSGNHGGKALWWFVAPVRTIVPEEQINWLELPCKRWDSLAFHCLFEEIEDLKDIFSKTIVGGKGGAPSEPGTLPEGSSPRAALAQQRAVASNLAAESMAMKREVHELTVAQMRRSVVADTGNSSTILMQRILAATKLKEEFDKVGNQADMVQYCDDEIKAMKAALRVPTTSPAMPSASPAGD